MAIQVEEKFMREALVEAKKAFTLKEVPIGAVAVYRGEIIARQHNRVEMLQDATAHAEMLCMRDAARVLGNWRLSDVILYATLEPCSMCAGALFLSRPAGLVWGAKDLRHGAHGSWVDLFAKPHPIHHVEIIGGVLAEEAAQLMQEFFRQRRSLT